MVCWIILFVGIFSLIRSEAEKAPIAEKKPFVNFYEPFGVNFTDNWKYLSIFNDTKAVDALWEKEKKYADSLVNKKLNEIVGGIEVHPSGAYNGSLRVINDKTYWIQRSEDGSQNAAYCQGKVLFTEAKLKEQLKDESVSLLRIAPSKEGKYIAVVSSHNTFFLMWTTTSSFKISSTTQEQTLFSLPLKKDAFCTRRKKIR